MDSNHSWSIFTYEYDTNIDVWVWHEWEVWLELWYKPNHLEPSHLSQTILKVGETKPGFIWFNFRIRRVWDKEWKWYWRVNFGVWAIRVREWEPLIWGSKRETTRELKERERERETNTITIKQMKINNKRGLTYLSFLAAITRCLKRHAHTKCLSLQWRHTCHYVMPILCCSQRQYVSMYWAPASKVQKKFSRVDNTLFCSNVLYVV